MSRKGENIYKRKDGRWEGRYCKTRDESGKIKYGYVYARTYTDTKSKLKLVKKECLSLPEKSTGNFSIHTFADVAGEWLLYKKRILKETSISKYNNIINIHLLPFFREQDIHNITLEQMEAFYNVLLMTKTAKGTALAPKTTLDILSVMKAILFYATTKKYMNILPVLRFEYRAVPKKLVVLSGRNQKILSTYLCLNLTYRNLGLLICMYTGIRLGDDDDKIRLNQRKPSKYKGLRRFGPEKNLQRINKFMKERPIFYKNLIQMKENIRFYLRCFYCITKVMILQFNSENRTELARNG